MMWFLLPVLLGCVPKVPPETRSLVGLEIRLPATEMDDVSVECVLRVVQMPYVTVEILLHNNSADSIILSDADTPLHVVHAEDQLFIFHGPSPTPTDEEIHLLLRDPERFHTVRPGDTEFFRGGFGIVPAATGVFFEPGSWAADFAPLRCAVPYWIDHEWSPVRIDGGHVAVSQAVAFRGVVRK